MAEAFNTGKQSSLGAGIQSTLDARGLGELAFGDLWLNQQNVFQFGDASNPLNALTNYYDLAQARWFGANPASTLFGRDYSKLGATIYALNGSGRVYQYNVDTNTFSQDSFINIDTVSTLMQTSGSQIAIGRPNTVPTGSSKWNGHETDDDRGGVGFDTLVYHPCAKFTKASFTDLGPIEDVSTFEDNSLVTYDVLGLGATGSVVGITGNRQISKRVAGGGFHTPSNVGTEAFVARYSGGWSTWVGGPSDPGFSGGGPVLVDGSSVHFCWTGIRGGVLDSYWMRFAGGTPNAIGLTGGTNRGPNSRPNTLAKHNGSIYAGGSFSSWQNGSGGSRVARYAGDSVNGAAIAGSAITGTVLFLLSRSGGLAGGFDNQATLGLGTISTNFFIWDGVEWDDYPDSTGSSASFNGVTELFAPNG